MNWFNRTKLADSAGGGGGGQVDKNDFHSYEGSPMFGQDKEISQYGKEEYKETDLEGYNDGVVKLKRQKAKPLKSKEPAVVKEDDSAHTGNSINLPFREGDRVRDRRRGNAFDQRHGRTKVNAKDQVFEVHWEGEEKPERFQLNDTIGIAKVLARV